MRRKKVKFDILAFCGANAVYSMQRYMLELGLVGS